MQTFFFFRSLSLSQPKQFLQKYIVSFSSIRNAPLSIISLFIKNRNISSFRNHRNPSAFRQLKKFLKKCISFCHPDHTSIVPEEIYIPPPALRATLPKMQEYLSSPMEVFETAILQCQRLPFFSLFLFCHCRNAVSLHLFQKSADSFFFKNFLIISDLIPNQLIDHFHSQKLHRRLIVCHPVFSGLISFQSERNPLHHF